jgi:molecular chaperone GrpE
MRFFLPLLPRRAMTNEENDKGTGTTPDDDLFLPPDGEPESELDVAKARIAELEAALGTAQAEAEDFKGRFLRKAADFENAKKRFQKESADLRQFAAESVLKEMVAVLDDMHRAMDHAPPASTGNPDIDNLVQGVRLVFRKFGQSLEKQGVVAVESLGQKFDPQLHEALQQVEDASVADGTVVREFQRAYRLHERLLRPAFVVVSRGGPRYEDSRSAPRADGADETVESEPEDSAGGAGSTRSTASEL